MIRSGKKMECNFFSNIISKRKNKQKQNLRFMHTNQNIPIIIINSGGDVIYQYQNTPVSKFRISISFGNFGEDGGSSPKSLNEITIQFWFYMTIFKTFFYLKKRTFFSSGLILFEIYTELKS